MIYFMTYYMGRINETNFVLGALLVAQISSIPVFAIISSKIGKKKTFICAASYWMLVMILSFFVTNQQHASIIYIFSSMVGIGSGGIVVMVYSIMPDVPDIDELYSGVRREGIYSGLMTFMRKLASAIGIFIVSQVISIAGFIKPIEQQVDGVTKLVKQQQTPEFFTALRIIFGILPVLFLLIAIYNAVRYRLTPDVHNRLNKLLTARRLGKEYDKNEEAELKRILENS